MKSKLKNTEQLFISVLKENNNRDEINQKIQNFKENDWQALYHFSLEKGLYPIFYTRLLNFNLENIPAEYLDKFRDLYLFNLKKNAFLEKEVFKILSAFRDAGITVIPLKGIFLTEYLYQDLALRQAPRDLDLLIRQERIKDASAVLKTLGYQADEERIAQSQKIRNEAYFVRRIANEIIRIDLHWSLRDAKFIHTHTQDFWSNAKEINIDGHQILAPSCEDLLLYLSLVAIFDGISIKIKYLYDIHALMQRFGDGLNWQILSERARKYNLDAALYFALSLAKELFHTPIAQERLCELRPRFIKAKLGRLRANTRSVLRSDERFFTDLSWKYFVLIGLYFNSASTFDFIKRALKQALKG